ncbi:hypothetical protein [Sneathiella sp. HT1-7]|uniref:hypothetical protein n=1 Tax=Sneathiella sp. HT1-7 TaxID=2887192 RepID=UPI001D143C1D|nr:hypothetical protein [Sneathiella sp. HT1-7]MCC3305967.1 hypothetical protein [Sneathiella sp. HT1-7]
MDEEIKKKNRIWLFFLSLLTFWPIVVPALFALPVFILFPFVTLELPDIDGAKMRSIKEIKYVTERVCGIDVDVEIVKLRLESETKNDGKASTHYKVNQIVHFNNQEYEVISLVLKDLKLLNFEIFNVELFGDVHKCRKLNP